jgi:hypothetical protein
VHRMCLLLEWIVVPGVLRGQQQVVGYLATASDRLFSEDVTLFFYHHANTPTDFIANIKRMVESSNRKCE